MWDPATLPTHLSNTELGSPQTTSKAAQSVPHETPDPSTPQILLFYCTKHIDKSRATLII